MGDILVLSGLAAAYFIPLIWCIYLGYTDDNDFMYVMCLFPLINMGMIGSHYECVKEEKIKAEKKAKALEEIKTLTEVCWLKIDFLDGERIYSNPAQPYWSEYYRGIVTSKESCEMKMNAIVNKGYFEKDGVRYPYHSMSSIRIETK